MKLVISIRSYEEIAKTLGPAISSFSTDVRNGHSDSDAWQKFIRIADYAAKSLESIHHEDGGPSWFLLPE